MNELAYESSLGGYLVWNLCVVHIDPMDWSILGRLSNPNTPPTSSSQSECSNVIIYGFVTTCSIKLLLYNFFLVPHAYEKEKRTLHFIA